MPSCLVFKLSIVHVIVYEAKGTAVVLMAVSRWLTRCHLHIPLRGVSQNLHSHALFSNVLALLMGMHGVCGAEIYCSNWACLPAPCYWDKYTLVR